MIQPAISVNVMPSLTNEQLSKLIQSCTPSSEHYERFQNFNVWLLDVCAAEVDRRGRQGELERGMTELPITRPSETAEWLTAIHARHYAQPNPLTHELLSHFCALASVQLIALDS